MKKTKKIILNVFLSVVFLVIMFIVIEKAMEMEDNRLAEQEMIWKADGYPTQ